MAGSELATIGAVKNVWEMLVTLLKANDEDKKRFLDEHVEPLQARLVEVHKDYVFSFQEVERHLRDKARPPRSLLDFLRERRHSWQHEHRLIMDLASEIARPENVRFRGELKNLVCAYALAVTSYFGCAQHVSYSTWYTDFLNAVEQNLGYDFLVGNVWEAEGISGDPREYLLDVVIQLLDSLIPDSFGRVSETYAKLRIRLV